MTEQLSIDDALNLPATPANAQRLMLAVEARKLARRNDVQTAKHAARLRGKATHRRAALEAHAANPNGLIDDDVERLTNLDKQEARRRCVDLRNLGLLEWLRTPDGRIVTRLNADGNPCSVSILTPEGTRAL